MIRLKWLRRCWSSRIQVRYACLHPTSRLCRTVFAVYATMRMDDVTNLRVHAGLSAHSVSKESRSRISGKNLSPNESPTILTFRNFEFSLSRWHSGSVRIIAVLSTLFWCIVSPLCIKIFGIPSGVCFGTCYHWRQNMKISLSRLYSSSSLHTLPRLPGKYSSFVTNSLKKDSPHRSTTYRKPVSTHLLRLLEELALE